MRVVFICALLCLVTAVGTKQALHRGLMNMSNFARSLQGKDIMTVDAKSCANPRGMEQWAKWDSQTKSGFAQACRTLRNLQDDEADDEEDFTDFLASDFDIDDYEDDDEEYEYYYTYVYEEEPEDDWYNEEEWWGDDWWSPEEGEAAARRALKNVNMPNLGGAFGSVKRSLTNKLEENPQPRRVMEKARSDGPLRMKHESKRNAVSTNNVDEIRASIKSNLKSVTPGISDPNDIRVSKPYVNSNRGTVKVGN